MLTIQRLCCMRLPTAGVVIGWLGGALSLLSVVVDAVALIQIDTFTDFVVRNQEIPTQQVTVSTAHVKTGLTVFLWVNLTVSAVNFVSSIFLIAGTLKERHLMLIPWLVNNGLVLVISLLNFFVIMCIAHGQRLRLSIPLVIILGMQYVLWTTIYSLYHHIRRQRAQQCVIYNVENAYYPPSTWV